MKVSDTREKAQLAYSKDSEGYDRHRLENACGMMLSAHDLMLFNEMLPLISSASQILEVGAGTGRFTMSLLENGKRVVATDINDEMLQLLRKKVKERKYDGQCHMQIEDAFSLSFDDNTFDVAMSFHVIPRLLSVADQEAAMTEIGRVVSPAGYLFFNFRNSYSPYNLIYRGHSISAKEMRSILKKNGFSIVAMKGKHLITRKLLDVLPKWARKLVVKMDAALWSFFPSLAWDVFVLAKKRED